MRPHILATGEYYHIYNRGVDKRVTFSDVQDYRKWLYAILTVNNGGEKPLVSIVCYAVMPNHYHFLMRQEVDGGITKLFHRAATSYSMYFNKRHRRDGRLWSAPFQSKHIDENAYLQHLMRYIHQNPLDLADRRTSCDPIEFLRKYPWTSFPAYSDGGFDPIVNAMMPALFSLADYQTYP